MKSTKKVLAVLLATAMLFAIYAISAFAISSDDGVSTNDYPKGSIDYTNGAIEGKGTLQFNPSTRTLTYILSCNNKSHEDLNEFRLFAQCAINYTDGSQDFDTVAIQALIAPTYGESIYKSFVIPSKKTVSSFDAEFFIMYGTETLWEGQIYHILTSNA